MTAASGSRALMVRLAAAGALLALLMLTTLTDTRNGAEAQTAPTTPRLTLVHQTPFVGPEGTFRIELSTRDLPAGSRLGLTVHPQVPSRARLERAMAGEQLGTTVASLAPTTITSPTMTLSLPIAAVWPAPPGGAVLSNAGVYPVVVQVTSATGAEIDRLVTQVLRLPAVNTATDALSVGTIVSVVADPTVAYDGAVTLSVAEAERARALLAVVAEPTSPELTLAASPFVLDRLTASGAVLPATLTTRPVLASSWVPIDTGSLLAAGQEQMVADEFRIGTTTLTSLLGRPPDPAVAVIDGATSPRALDLTIDRGARAVVLGSGQVRSPTDTSTVLTQQFAIASADGRRVPAMAADDMSAVPFAFERDQALAAHRALAMLTMLHFEQPGVDRGVALALPGGTSPTALREFLGGLAQRDGAESGSIGASVLTPTTLGGLFATTSIATDRTGTILRSWNADEPVPLGAYGPALEQARWDLRGTRTLVPDATALTDPIDRTILSSAARFVSNDARLTMLAGAQRSMLGLTGSITMPSTQTVTLTSRTGDIPLSFDNALSAAAHVRVTLSSPKLDFPDGETLDLVLPSGSTRASVRVTTRATGAFPLQVSVTSADGILPITASRVDVRSTAVSGLGVVLSVGAGVFLAVWWIRHFRHTRRARSLIDVNGVKGI